MDFGKKWSDGKYILGKNKTIRGFVSGVVGGTIAGILIAYISPIPYFNSHSSQMFASFLLALGTMVGDALGSFIKRRLNIHEGKPFILDSCFFIFVAILFSVPVLNASFYTIENLLFILILTIILHPLANKIANMLGMKKVPW